MKFLYKVYSPYDGFTPDQIPARTLAGGRLRLGWRRYFDVVDVGDDVWVWYTGGGVEKGVYVKGRVDSIDTVAKEVFIRILQSSTDAPLTDAQQSASMAGVVAARGIQVFLLPEFLDVAPDCDLTTNAATCAKRECGGCRTWQAFPLIEDHNLITPARLPKSLEAYVPAYWVIARRSFLWYHDNRPREPIRRASEMFYRFKLGQEHLAFPLALGIREGLAKRGLDQCDAVVAVPLSPDKLAAGEINRTELLAIELGRQLGTPVQPLLSLSEPVTKRSLRTNRGFTAPQFEWAYRRKLDVATDCTGLARVVLIDDVCTEGSTLRVCAAALQSAYPRIEIVAATAGQMTNRAAVADDADLIERV